MKYLFICMAVLAASCKKTEYYCSCMAESGQYNTTQTMKTDDYAEAKEMCDAVKRMVESHTYEPVVCEFIKK